MQSRMKCKQCVIKTIKKHVGNEALHCFLKHKFSHPEIDGSNTKGCTILNS